MCTLTAYVVGVAGGGQDGLPQKNVVFKPKCAPWQARLIVTMSRDEAVVRHEGTPVLQCKNQRFNYWHPTDAQAGGSWFGVNRAGVVAALLNRYQDTPVKPFETYSSRGLIVPKLLACFSKEAVLTQLAALDVKYFMPFDVWVFVGGQRCHYAWDGQQAIFMLSEHNTHFLAMSSSADYVAAKQYRQAAFEQFGLALQANVNPQNVPAEIISQLHQKRCAFNSSLGFNMQRPGRHTKSICQAVITPNCVSYRYVPEAAMAALP